MFNKTKLLKKMKDYFDSWDTEDHGYVHIYEDGRLCPTNNINLGELTVTKADFGRIIKYIEQNA